MTSLHLAMFGPITAFIYVADANENGHPSIEYIVVFVIPWNCFRILQIWKKMDHHIWAGVHRVVWCWGRRPTVCRSVLLLLKCCLVDFIFTSNPRHLVNKHH